MGEDFKTYPISIRESRYGGIYSGSAWVITAGVYSPGKTDAFGGSIPCMQFWKRVRKDGPIITLEDPVLGDNNPVYVASGSDPNELYESMKEYMDE